MVDADLLPPREGGGQRTLLRFITCGSVDDGKSTLIGRLLHDAHAVFADQLVALEADSRRVGTQGGAIDFALLVDGLSAEREQGITIDVAHRYFSTPRRSFIVADTPGHEQYTRNMVTAASNADLAVILVDARKGVLTQTRRHSHLVRLMGVRQVVLAVNKMDLVANDRATFEGIVAEYRAFADELGLPAATAIPVSGLNGDNVTRPSEHMEWYDGPTLLGHLESVPVDLDAAQAQPFAMSVQWVNRPDGDFRGFAGRVASGRVRPGDAVRIVPSGRLSAVGRIVTADGDLEQAVAGQSVTLTLADEVDVSRGAVIASAADAPEAADRFQVTIVWMSDEALLPGRRYWLKLGTELVGATVPVLHHAIDVNTRAERVVETLGLNDIALGEVRTERPIAFRPFEEGSALGGFILIDTVTNATVGAGTIGHALRRAGHVHWQALEVGREAHASQKGQRPRVLWFTGLSGSGKSTVANLVEKKLHALGRHSFLLDGDNVRHGLNRDLGFSDADRVENVRRVGEVARLMADAGLIVLTAFISPFRAERDMVRALLPEGEFVEIYVDTPLHVAEARDVKGLYAKARAGLLPNFTGIDSPYEPPVRPDIRIDTQRETAETAAERIVAEIVGVWSPTL